MIRIVVKNPGNLFPVIVPTRINAPPNSDSISRPRAAWYPSDSITRLPPSQSQKARPAARVARKASIPRARVVRIREASQTRAGAATTPGKIFMSVPSPAVIPPRMARPENHHRAAAKASTIGASSNRPITSGASRKQ